MVTYTAVQVPDVRVLLSRLAGSLQRPDGKALQQLQVTSACVHVCTVCSGVGAGSLDEHRHGHHHVAARGLWPCNSQAVCSRPICRSSDGSDDYY